MVCANKFFTIVVAILFAKNTWGQQQPTKLITKQAINNLRFISRDGKFTYFQKLSGVLQLSTNYKIFDVLKGKPGAQYLVFGSKDQKRLLVSRDDYFHTYLSSRHNQRLYKVEYGQNLAKEIGIGINAQIHLQDTWASYYDAQLHTIFFKNLENDALQFKVLTSNTLDPYFLPQTAMISPDQAYFSDINNKGIVGVINYDRKLNKLIPIYKANSPNERVEFCFNETDFFIMNYGINRLQNSTTLYKIPLNKLVEGISAGETLYQNNKSDLGKLICDYKKNTLFFIQNQSTTLKEQFEVVSFDVQDKKIITRTKLGFATALINMDGILLVPFRSDYYIIEGNTQLINDSLVVNPKSLSIPAPVENTPAPMPTQTPTPTSTATPNPTPTAAPGATPPQQLSPVLPNSKGGI